jgi:hypothetical protein
MAKQAKRQLAGSGEALPAGAIGEVITVSGQASASNDTTNYYSFAGFTLNPGTYVVCLNVQANGTSTTGVVGCISKTSATSANLDPEGFGSGADFKSAGMFSAPASGATRASTSFFLQVTATGTYYIRVRATGGTSLTNLGWVSVLRLN